MTLSNIEKKILRQHNILYSLEKMQFATRKQIQTVHKLGTDRNASAVLKGMNHLLHAKVIGRLKVYYMNEQGRSAIGTQKEVKWSIQVEHALARNDIYIRYDCPKDWEVEPLYFFKSVDPAVPDLTIKPDAQFTSKGKKHLLEVDRLQSMKENENKMMKYRKAGPALTHEIGHSPIIMFYTMNQRRKERLAAISKELKFLVEILTKEDIE